ncbi:hypothetical protein PAPYRUS_56 [Mycobacterium phage Papyrus]|uniref:CDGP domain-containing protein n=1 Tax=Mycobacterium phage Papyrus TaxID=1383056 RepID=S5Z9B8_9CAUD|nr:hypothetical protein N842_gp056 [Mycobacterium phage Papyrus]AGT14066.1 hypothetical protein PAPYRUS_56 [Mycobacterium phage Papyrus]
MPYIKIRGWNMKRNVKEVVVAFLLTMGLFFALAAIHNAAVTNVAKADPGVGCETIRWGFLGSQRRTICDGPRRPDGSWERLRLIWTPAGYVPRYTYCGSYTCSSSGGYYREETLQGKETYVVFDHNVLPDEPGWLPPGTDIIR